MSLMRRRMMMPQADDSLTPVHTELEYTNAGDFLGNIKGNWGTSRDFYKINNGLCIFCFVFYQPTWLTPIAIALTPDAAAVRYSGVGSDNMAAVYDVNYGGVTYAVMTGGGAFSPGTTSSFVLNTISTAYTNDASGYVEAATDLLNYYYGVI